MSSHVSLEENPRWADQLQRRALELIWVATSLSMLGRGWLHFSKGSPYWNLFWSEELLSPWLSLLGVEWSSYVESTEVEAGLNVLSMSLGVLYLSLSVVIAYASVALLRSGEAPSSTPLLRRSLRLLLGLQVVYVASYWLGRSLYLPIWLEQSTLIALPWLCLSTGLQRGERAAVTSSEALYLARAPITVTRVAISCTFIGHGAFALGLYPVPDDYLVMVMRTFECSQQRAQALLWWAGALDVLTALAVWTPRRYLRVRWAALTYMLIWGGVTACARVVGHWGQGSFTDTVWYWLPELMLRVPHALIPCWLLTLEGGVRPYWRRRSLATSHAELGEVR